MVSIITQHKRHATGLFLLLQKKYTELSSDKQEHYKIFQIVYIHMWCHFYPKTYCINDFVLCVTKMCRIFYKQQYPWCLFAGNPLNNLVNVARVMVACFGRCGILTHLSIFMLVFVMRYNIIQFFDDLYVGLYHMTSSHTESG